MKIDRKSQITNHKSQITLFDFDGTLSMDDANQGFYKYCFRHSLRPWLFVPVILCGAVLWLISFVLVRLCIISNISRLAVLWREMLRMFYTPALVERLLPGFISEFRQNRFGWAKDQIAKEKENGNIVILSSAGPDYLIIPLVRDMGFDYIITSNSDPLRPWKILFFNYGENKVESLKAIARAPMTVVRAYSDSESDLPMMNLARAQVWIDPKTGLRKN
ncbi:MAG: haloacid dehalogenase-like hydrolase [Rickettsiales bacterium]|jgi:phosphoserine phosphatase|nr:haloacid dehalogenase-like hydrolase [Rickettsiales bacterium]